MWVIEPVKAQLQFAFAVVLVLDGLLAALLRHSTAFDQLRVIAEESALGCPALRHGWAVVWEESTIGDDPAVAIGDDPAITVADGPVIDWPGDGVVEVPSAVDGPSAVNCFLVILVPVWFDYYDCVGMVLPTGC